MLQTLNISGRLLSFARPQIMGIINTTPDSFYAESRQQSVYAALLLAEKMIQEGAAILDIGGMSSRPGAELINAEEEQARLLPIVTAIAKRFSDEVFISVDTIYGSTAKAAVEAGAGMINDISAGQLDSSLLPTVAQLRVPYVLMHSSDAPAVMQQKTVYPEGVLLGVVRFLADKIQQLRQLGITDVLIDPGFGFGKTIAQNFALLQHLDSFLAFGLPLLVGVSRKGMIWRSLGVSPDDALNGTTAIHTLALLKGAKVLRVHDVAAVKQVIDLLAYMNPINEIGD